MKILLLLLTICMLTACNKNETVPAGDTGSNNTGSQNNTPAISVFVNDSPINVNSITYGRSSSTFNFSAQNNLQKVDVKCFWFYQQNWGNFQYSDSINYSERADTDSKWNTIRAIGYGNVHFDCCSAPLTDHSVSGNYSGIFLDGKIDLTVNGKFQLLFK